MNSFLIKEKDMFTYDSIICNSKFTQTHVNKLTKRKTQVIYPPVKTEHLKPKKKKDIVKAGSKDYDYANLANTKKILTGRGSL